MPDNSLPNQALPPLKFKRLHPDAKAPAYATSGAACFDVAAIIEGDTAALICPGLPITFRTGLAFEIPAGYVLNVYSRSGAGFNHDTRLANAVGKIDSDYKGELMVKLTRDGAMSDPLLVRNGDRIAQVEMVPAPQVELVEVFELSESARGANGFGSTGAQ